jgi:hypothetical protein
MLLRWTLFAALPFVEDWLLKFCLFSGSVSVSVKGLAIIVLSLPL